MAFAPCAAPALHLDVRGASGAVARAGAGSATRGATCSCRIAAPPANPTIRPTTSAQLAVPRMGPLPSNPFGGRGRRRRHRSAKILVAKCCGSRREGQGARSCRDRPKQSDTLLLRRLPPDELACPSMDGPMQDSPHVLIVDDDRELLRLLARFLERHGLRASTARDGREMRRVLADWRIDLVVLDLMLPGEDGLALCRQLRATCNIPIIMLTAMGEETDRIVGLEMGADDYLP